MARLCDTQHLFDYFLSIGF